MKKEFVKIAVFVLFAVFAVYSLTSCKPPKKKGEGTGEAVSAADKVKVEFYIMSQCPFGTQVQKGIKPVLDKMGAYIDYKQEFIAKELGGGKFNSLHGEKEVMGDIAQLCMARYYPESYKYMDAVMCMAEDMKNIPNNWKDCAAKNGLDTQKLQTCYDGEEGKNLLSESAKRAKEAKAEGSPTMFIAGEKYTGGRGDKELETAICCNFGEANKPGVCPADMKCPKRVPVDLTVLSDKRCKECEQRSKMMIQNFKDRFPKLNVTMLDYADAKGKALFEKAQLQHLPAYVFDQNIKEDTGYTQVQRWLRPAGDFLVLMTGSKFDPKKEICDNQIDDTGNGAVDCDDEDCKGTLVCREEKANTFDLFTMSECPFGTKAVDAMDEVIKNFKNGLSFDLHYIINVMTEDEWNKLPPMRKTRCVKKEDEMYYCSLHGEHELDENLRQACAIKYYGKNYKYMKYILCRNLNIKDPEWKKCATDNKMDAGKIEKCATTDEGLALLRDDAELTQTLGFSGSPSWLGNNKQKLIIRDRSSEGIKKEICKINQDLQGCENTLTSTPPGGKKSGSCG